MLLSIQHLTFGWTEDTLFEKIDCTLKQGEMAQLSGENGAGKTTLLNLIAGFIPHFNRGTVLHGDILIDERSILSESPKHFYPKIALVPGMHLELFLLTETLSEEILLTRAFLKIDKTTFKNRQNKFVQFFPEIADMLNMPIENMHVGQKTLALTFIYYLQNARLYLFDEVLSTFSQSQIDQWYAFFNELITQNSAVIFIDHHHNAAGTSQWLLKDKKLIQL